MAAGEKFHGSNIRLAGYLKLLDNPIYLGLADNAYITTSISSNSLDITNLSGDIDINATNVYLNTNLISSPGLFKYQADYSGIYDNRTLVDKEYVDNQINLVGVSYWDLNTAGELVLNLGVPGPVMPHTTNIVDLGSSTYKWQDLFLSGSINKVTVNNAYTLPSVDGTSGQILMTDGSGVVSWQTDTVPDAWVLNGNTNGVEKYIGTNDNYALPFRVNNNEVARFTTDGAGLTRLYINANTNLHGSNAGIQYSTTFANRAQLRTNAYGNHTGVPGITGFKSRGATVGSTQSVLAGDTLFRITAIGISGDNSSLNLAAFIDVKVPTGGVFSSYVATDFTVDLMNLAGVRSEKFKVTSEGNIKINNIYTLPNIDGTSGQVLKTNGAGVVTWQTDASGFSNLADLNDVNFITGTPIDGDILVYNGTEWEARELPLTFNVSGAINSKKATNQYVESDGAGMFLSPFILPDNATLKYMSASCATTGTWTAEVHVNGTLFTGATVTVTAAKKAYIKFTSILSFSAGDEIQLYLNGTNIDKPRISAVFVAVP